MLESNQLLSNETPVQRQSALLLFLVDELSASDRAEFEQQLAQDAVLRRELSELSTAQDSIHEAFAGYDSRARLPAPASVLVRNASRAINRWSVMRAVKPAASADHGRGMAIWKISAAAMLLVGIGLGLELHHSRSQRAVVAIEPISADAVAQLDDSQSQALLEAFTARVGDDSSGAGTSASALDASATATPAVPNNVDTVNATANNLDDQDRAFASLKRADNLDSIFTGVQDYFQ